MSTVEENVFLAEGSQVIGDVTVRKNCSVWYNAVIRGDSDHIEIGEGSNVQDNCVVHVDAGYPVQIGKGVTIGHGAILHGCTIGDNSLIGMGAIVLNGAVIGKNCLIGAGALVTQNTKIPDGSLAFGSPAKVVRPTKPEEIASNRDSAIRYQKVSAEHIRNGESKS